MHVLGERQQLHMSFVFVGGVLSEGFIFAYVPFHSDPSCPAHCSSLLLRYLGGIIRCCRETQRRRRMQDLWQGLVEEAEEALVGTTQLRPGPTLVLTCEDIPIHHHAVNLHPSPSCQGSLTIVFLVHIDFILLPKAIEIISRRVFPSHLPCS